jgi:hypothetical protein
MEEKDVHAWFKCPVNTQIFPHYTSVRAEAREPATARTSADRPGADGLGDHVIESERQAVLIEGGLLLRSCHWSLIVGRLQAFMADAKLLIRRAPASPPALSARRARAATRACSTRLPSWQCPPSTAAPTANTTSPRRSARVEASCAVLPRRRFGWWRQRTMCWPSTIKARPAALSSVMRVSVGWRRA